MAHTSSRVRFMRVLTNDLCSSTGINRSNPYIFLAPYFLYLVMSNSAPIPTSIGFPNVSHGPDPLFHKRSSDSRWFKQNAVGLIYDSLLSASKRLQSRAI